MQWQQIIRQSMFTHLRILSFVFLSVLWNELTRLNLGELVFMCEQAALFLLIFLITNFMALEWCVTLFAVAFQMKLYEKMNSITFNI